jgi:hypothetical protein
LVNGPSDVYGARIPEAGGGVRVFGQTKVVDTEEYAVAGLLHYRTIVRRASAVSSRPSSAFRLVWIGRYHEVWQQPAQPERVLDHVALEGSGAQPASRPKCSLVLSVARLAGPGGRLATVERLPVTIVNLPGTPVWKPKSRKSEAPVPDNLRSGSLKGTVTVPATDLYTLWITGSFYRRIELLVDGEPVAKERRELSGEQGDAFYIRIGSRRLAAGSHSVELRYGDEGALHPGTGGHAAFAPGLQPRVFTFGPLALLRDDANSPVTYVASSRARALCGKRLDWLEPIGPETVVP